MKSGYLHFYVRRFALLNVNVDFLSLNMAFSDEDDIVDQILNIFIGHRNFFPYIKQSSFFLSPPFSPPPLLVALLFLRLPIAIIGCFDWLARYLFIAELYL